MVKPCLKKKKKVSDEESEEQILLYVYSVTFSNMWERLILVYCIRTFYFYFLNFYVSILQKNSCLIFLTILHNSMYVCVCVVCVCDVF